MNESIDDERYDPLDPSMQQDPLPGYVARCRHAPVWKHPDTGVVFASRHGPVSQVLADPATFSSRGAGMPTSARAR